MPPKILPVEILPTDMVGLPKYLNWMQFREYPSTQKHQIPFQKKEAVHYFISIIIIIYIYIYTKDHSLITQ